MPDAFVIGRELAQSTVRLVATMSDGRTATGTGFFLGVTRPNSSGQGLILVTNKHVIGDATRIVMRIRLADTNGGPPNGRMMDLELLPAARWLKHSNPKVDLAAVGVGGGMDTLVTNGQFPHVTSIGQDIIATSADLNDLFSGEDVMMIGYPNGVFDTANNFPIVRRGITATAPALNFDGDPVFMIDIAAFPGSSGSPVFLYNPAGYRTGSRIEMGTRLKLIGVLYAGPQITAAGEIVVRPTPTATTVETRLMMNLGLCVKATEMQFFLDWIATHDDLSVP